MLIEQWLIKQTPLKIPAAKTEVPGSFKLPFQSLPEIWKQPQDS